MKPREFYNAVAVLYDQRHDSPATRHLRKKEFAIIQKYARGRTLDVGCGTGSYLRPGVVGLDLSEKMLALARAQSRMLVQGNEILPFTTGAFDTVLCMFTVANMTDSAVLAKEAFRVLRPGGHVILSVASVHDNSKNLEKKIQVAGFKMKFSLFTKKKLLADFADFQVQEFQGVFIDVLPDWGGYRPFSREECQLLIRESERPQDEGRLLLVVFRRHHG